MRYLLDTDTCIDLLRGHPATVARAGAIPPGDCAVSTVTRYELLVGAAKCRHPGREARKIECLLDAMPLIPFHAEAAAQAARVRADLEAKGARMGPYDILLAGQALAGGLTMVTSNVREFDRIEGLGTESWRKPRDG